MRTLFAVTRTTGEAWDADKPMRSQEQWTAHADFMERLTANGFIILGGPLGDQLSAGGEVLLLVDAPSETDVAATLSGDPWSKSGTLRTKRIRRWTVLLESGKK